MKLPGRDWGYEEEGEEDQGLVDNISLADTKDNANSDGDSVVDPVQRLRRSIILHRIGLFRLALIAISSLLHSTSTASLTRQFCQTRYQLQTKC